MRKNLPITNKEILVPENWTLISKTDPKGIITLANEIFEKTSGFASGELIGQPHNIIRHPEMPPEIFREMWSIIKEGKPWNGIMKNRTKNGDFYWVDATITPEYNENHQIVGFISVRKRAEREQIEKAKKLYSDLNNGVSIKKQLSISEFIQNFSIKSRILSILILLIIPIIYLFSILIMNKFEEIKTAEKEREGANYNSYLAKSTKELAIHRGLMNRYLNTKDELALETAVLKEKKVNEILSEIRKKHSQLTHKFHPEKDIEKLISDWETLRLNNKSMTAQESFSKHINLIEKLIEIYQDVGNKSGLYYLNEPKSRLIAEISLNRIIYLVEETGKLRATGSVIATASGRNLDNILKTKFFLGSVGTLLKETESSFRILFTYPDSDIFEKNKKFQEIRNKLMEKMKFTEEKLISSETQKETSSEIYFSEMTLIINDLYHLTDDINNLLISTLEEKKLRLKNQLWTSFGIAGLFLFLEIFLLFKVIRSITGRLRNSLDNIRDIARGGGDLRKKFDITANDEISELSRWMNVFTLSLTEIIYQLRRESDNLKKYADLTKVMVGDYSLASQEQASSTEETAAAVEELSASVENVTNAILIQAEKLKEINSITQDFKRNTETASHSISTLNQLTEIFSKEAQKGAETTKKCIAAIEEVNTNAASIDKIVLVIKEISDRTNLLALNAAIEAERAGDAGRGFAVVASEISKLADQTALNTKNIGSLTGETKRSIQNSVAMVNTTMKSLESLITGVGKIKKTTSEVAQTQENQSEGSKIIEKVVSEIFSHSSQIVEATQQQKIAVAEIANSVQSIAINTQIIADGSMKLSDTAGEMNSVSTKFTQLISQFKY